MPDYLPSANAKEDLKRIYAYGYFQFGEEQADEYFHSFFQCFKKITANRYIDQSIDLIRPGYRRCPCGSDSIYYRINSSMIEIMAILGGQDIGDWL